MYYGYARCSTNEDKQDIRRQIRKLKNAGADEVVFEYESGDAGIKQNLQMVARIHEHIVKQQGLLKSIMQFSDCILHLAFNDIFRGT